MMKPWLTFFACSLRWRFFWSAGADVLKSMNAQWLRCYVGSDSVTLGGILGDDFILTAPNGQWMTRSDVLHNLAHPKDSFDQN